MGTYSTVLFFYMLYPSLCRTSMDILSCQNPSTGSHTSSYGLQSDVSHNTTIPAWQKELYLRYDVEEPCYKGNHLSHVGLIAIPSMLAYAVGLPLSAFIILWRRRGYRQLETKKYIFRLGLVYSGYRPNRWWWEGIVVLRKLSVICFSSFMHDDALQLQFAFGIMVVNFAHHMYLPFDVNEDTTDKDKYLEEDAESGHFLGEGLLLHRLERNSIIVSMMLLWSASVFTMRLDCGKTGWEFCSFVVLGVFLSNIVFLISGVYLYVYLFLKRTKLAKHVMGQFRKGIDSFRSQRRADGAGNAGNNTAGDNIGVTVATRVENPAYGAAERLEQSDALCVAAPANPLFGHNKGLARSSAVGSGRAKMAKNAKPPSELRGTAVEMIQMEIQMENTGESK